MQPNRSTSFKAAGHALDAELLRLQRILNAKANTGRVTLACSDPAGLGSYSLIFQAGSRRRTVKLQARPTEQDADEIAAALDGWATARAADYDSLWTSEVPEW